MLAPPTNLVNWSKRSEPLFERSLGLSVSGLSVKLLWTLTLPDVAVKALLQHLANYCKGAFIATQLNSTQVDVQWT